MTETFFEWDVKHQHKQTNKPQCKFLSFGEIHVKRLFHTIVDNGRITNAEFDNGWHSADFALLSDADSLFSVLDHNNDQAITAQPDMSHLFTSYDNNRKLHARI